MTTPGSGEGHHFDIPLDQVYSHSNLGESDYEPTPGDLLAPRYVRFGEFQTPPYAARPVDQATNFGGQVLKGQTAPDG